MARSTKETLRSQPAYGSTTPIDKTTRLAWEIMDAETEAREVKNARLRKARQEREAATPPEPPKAPKATKTPKAPKTAKSAKPPAKTPRASRKKTDG